MQSNPNPVSLAISLVQRIWAGDAKTRGFLFQCPFPVRSRSEGGGRKVRTKWPEKAMEGRVNDICVSAYTPPRLATMIPLVESSEQRVVEK